MKRYRRWSDRDHHFGPFITLAGPGKGWRPWAVVLSSGDDDNRGCNLRMAIAGYTLILELPPIIQPHRRKVHASSWDSATVTRMGRDWYYDTHPRDFGFSYNDGFLQVFLGPHTHDSATTRMWCKHLPWTQWRHVRRSFYGRAGEHFWTEPSRRQVPSREAWDKLQEMEAACPLMTFEFDDYDGQRLTASARIEEREYRFGEGWFKWLSLFRRPMIRRELSIRFSGETGPKKGSWKGGVTGSGIELLRGELHESGFRRYCAANGLTFLGGPQQ